MNTDAVEEDEIGWASDGTGTFHASVAKLDA